MEKYEIKDNTLIFNEGITEINTYDLHFINKEGLPELNPEIKGITDIIIPDSVKVIGNKAFAFCESLKSIDISNSVIHIDRSAFAYCKSLESITLPDRISKISHAAFMGCASLKKINIPNNVTAIESIAFAGCPFEDVIIPDNVTELGSNAFACCEFLENITLPDSITTIGEESFDMCKNLTIHCNKESYAESYAKKNGIPFEYIDKEKARKKNGLELE